MLVDVWDEKKFQFTHPGGVRPAKAHIAISQKMFQFTHPGGVRQRFIGLFGLFSVSFNSRTREGCDY